MATQQLETSQTLSGPDQETSQTSPAQQAIQTALILATIAQAGVHPYADAFTAGKISRNNFVTAAAKQLLASMHSSRIVGAQAAETTWQAPVRPQPIQPDDQRMIQASIRTIITRTTQEPKLAGVESPLVRRIGSLAEAQCVLQCRTSYATSVAEVLQEAEHDQEDLSKITDAENLEEVWRFVPDGRACERCKALAREVFTSLDDVPMQGSHIHCRCSVEVYRRKDEL